MLDSVYAQWGDALQPWIIPLVGLAILLTSVAIAIRMWTGRRRFSRRNIAGVEEFGSYGTAVGSRLLEGLLDTLAAVLFVIGVVAGVAAAYSWWLVQAY